ncbi:PREDICTED: uncharacterized protein LOC106302678 [Brassica oleracea var. oleracea]|uniref:uncharacterized protein LOC106302678 n=1 Tax=Brassica oleracea var. oleracea TaxID=109376 RepID=UPI0006A72C53|nr:PREDICTED: uncharacterized protein LOC106302678 [Brassica oleracea var. oleracea]
MFTRQEATATDLWNLNHANGQSLRDFMEKFKSIVSKVDVPDHIAVESLMNTIHIKSPFRADLYRHPMRSVPDAIARSNNFIRMEEDTRAKAAKEAAGKQTPARTNDAHQEPRQHSTSGKPNQRKGYMNAIDDAEPSGSAAMPREKGWNHWDRDTSQPRSSSPEPANSNAVEPSKWCSYHEVKSHDTKDCKVLYRHFLKSIESGKIEIESLHKLKNNKNWSKNKEKKVQKSQTKAPQREEQTNPEKAMVNNLNLEGESTDEEPPKNRRRVEVILPRQANSSDDEIPPVPTDLHEKLGRKTESKDLRTLLKRNAEMVQKNEVDLRTSLDESKARKTTHAGVALHIQPQPADLREQINSKAEELRAKLGQFGIGECQVTKVLVDTGSSVDLIFRDTLDKMGVDLRDMKPSSRTLTGFNGSSEQMIGTIRLPVYAGDVTRTVKFSIIRAKELAPLSSLLSELRHPTTQSSERHGYTP